MAPTREQKKTFISIYINHIKINIMKLTSYQLSLLIELEKQCKDFEAFRFEDFRFEDFIIKGDRVGVLKKYVKENPSKKFLTWASDKDLILDI